MKIRLWQFSDTHLLSDPDGELYGCRTGESLRTVLDDARSRIQPEDLVVVTGDLVHDESEQGYQTLVDMFEILGVPVFCLPGNHDDPALLRSLLQTGTVRYVPEFTTNGWQFFFLDSTVHGMVAGRLDETSCRALTEGLQLHPDRHAAIFLHHPPLATGMAWLDNGQILENPQQLFQITDAFPRVRAVCWGHAHVASEAMRNEVRMLGCPSTMVQFRPGCREFSLDPVAPGYRWLDCFSDGSTETGIIRLPAVNQPMT